jgi:hypothetical protein
VDFALAIYKNNQRTMPLPVISSRNSFIGPELDTSSMVTNATPITGHLDGNTVTATTNFTTDSISNSIATTSSSCEVELGPATTDIQTMSTSLQSSTLSDSCSDDFINEPLQSPPTPPTELLLNDSDDSTPFLEPMIPLTLGWIEEDRLSVTMLALYEVRQRKMTFVY